jgi:hypothetical protein
MISIAEERPRACIIFRTHFWDDFVRRQFDRLLAVSGSLDVFVLVDETNGPVAGIAHDKVARVTESDVLDMGFAKAGEGSLLWFNGDYPLYWFAERHPDYALYLQLEYDVVIDAPVETLVARAAADGVDYVGLTKGEATPDWFWLSTCTAAYDIGEIRHELICLSLFSARALRHLAARRLEHSELFRTGLLQGWPMCEGFIATEMHGNGFVCRELSDFGDTGRYDHWPPYLEIDIEAPAGARFIHPVLDPKRYVASMHKYRVGAVGLLNPASLYHRKLRRLPARRYAAVLASTFAGKAVSNLKSVFARRR